MELVERDDAMARLAAAAEEARNGHGRIVLVSGAVATGKTALSHAFAEGAVEEGLLPVMATASAAEQHLPLGVIRQLVEDAPLQPSERERALALISEGGHVASCAETLDQVDADIVHGLCTVLMELSESCPLVVAVDDTEYADRASLSCLNYLARRVRGARMVVLFTSGGHAGHAQSRFEIGLLRMPNCGLIELAPLSVDGVHAFVADRIGADEAPRLAPGWYALTGGNPVLLHALLTDHGNAAGPVDRYGRAVLSCLHRGDPQALRVAQGAAVLGDTRDLASLLTLDAAQVADTVRALVAAGLFDDGGLRHGAARAAVLTTLEPRDRSALNGRAARLAYERGAPSTVVADHLLEAGPVGARDDERAWVVSSLREAARRAVRAEQAESAIAYLRLALELSTDARDRSHIANSLIQAEWWISPGTLAGRFPELTEAVRKGHLRGADAVVLAKALLWHGRVDQARDVLEHLTAPGQEVSPETSVEVATARHWLRCTHPSFFRLLRSAAEPGRPVVHSLSADRRLRAVSALSAVLTGGPRPQLVAAVDKVLRGPHLDEMALETVESALFSLVYVGAADKALPWCDRFLAEATSRPAPSRRARLAAVRAEISWRLGDLAGAYDHATAALRIVPLTGWGVTVGVPLSTLVLAATAMGRHEEAHAHLDQWVPDAMFDTRYGIHYLYARARFALATGDLALAMDDFQRCGALMRAWKLDTSGLVPWRVDAAEAYLRMGRPRQARQLIEEQTTGHAAGGRRVTGAATRVRAALGNPSRRPALLRQAADLLQSTDGDRYELARTLADLAHAYRDLGEFRRAGLAERRARVVATECQAGAIVRELAVAVETPAPAPPVGGLLSEAEHRVATLAAVGCSNREIADNLHVTVSTVEQHLTRVYRKLRISRRVELPAKLDTPAPPDAMPAPLTIATVPAPLAAIA